MELLRRFGSARGSFGGCSGLFGVRSGVVRGSFGGRSAVARGSFENFSMCVKKFGFFFENFPNLFISKSLGQFHYNDGMLLLVQ